MCMEAEGHSIVFTVQLSQEPGNGKMSGGNGNTRDCASRCAHISWTLAVLLLNIVGV